MQKEMEKWLEESIHDQKKEIELVKRQSANCYGHGFEMGYLEALLEMKVFITDLNNLNNKWGTNERA